MCQAALLTLWIHREPARPSNPTQSSGVAKPEMSEGVGVRKDPAEGVLFAGLKEKGAVVQGEGELQGADVETYEQGQVESGRARSQEAGRLSLFWEKVRQDDVKVRSHCYEKVGKMQERDQRLLPARGRL